MTQPPYQGQPQQPYQAPQQPAQASAPPQQPFGQGAPGPRPHPLSGVPWSDYVRDGAAALLLLASLAMPWDASHDATDRIEVVLLTLLSVLSLSAMYLHRTAVIPASVRPETVALGRALANAPYALVVVIYAVIDLVQAFRNDGSVQGLGMAAGFGLAGALLAAAPRSSELAIAADQRALAELWRRVVLGVGAAALAWAALATLSLLLRIWTGPFPLAEYLGAAQVTILLFDPLLVIASLAALTLPALKRSAAGRVAAITASALYMGACVIDLLSGWEIQGAFETAGFSVPFAISVLALGAAQLAAPVRLAMTPTAGAALYLPGAAYLLLGFAVFASANVGIALIGLAVGGGASGPLVAVIVLWAAASAALFAARATLRRDPLGMRTAVTTLLGGVALLGVIVLILQAQDSLSGATQRTDLVVLLGVPIAVGVLLFVPPSVRAYYAGAAPTSAAGSPAAASPAPYAQPVPYSQPAPAAQATPYAPQAGVAQPATYAHPAPAAAPAPAASSPAPAAAAPTPPPAPTAPPAPPVDPALVAAVEHPMTDAATLHRIAAEAPWLRSRVAAHPQAYPDLLAWLGALGDPEIDAALARRGR